MTLVLFKQKLLNSYKSLTMWFNGLMLSVIAAFPVLQDNLPNLQQYLPAKPFQWLGLIVVIANLALRFKTVKPLEDK